MIGNDGTKDVSRHDIRTVLKLENVLDLGDELVKRRLISTAALSAARMESVVTGARLGNTLVRNGLLQQRELISTILEAAPEELTSERVAHSRIPLHLLRRYRILLAAETQAEIYVSTLASEDVAGRIVSEWYPDKDVRFVAYDPEHMSDFLVRMEMNVGAGSAENVREDERLENLVVRAYDQQASDIHIIPKGRSYSVFFRLLGTLQIVHEGSLSEYRALCSQIKNRAGMDIAETRVPQDGVFKLDFGAKVVDYRTVTVPVVGGEYIVVRILDPESVRNNLDSLGISRVSHWRRGFNQPNGLCLICGPTGSGKTTTLSATVAEMDRFGSAIFTVEDPVEFPIAYAGQVSVNKAVGLEFASSLRAFMRADPDIINIGEVRDEETARTMVRAAETGHMVLATLHASSIRGAVNRLQYLGVPAADLEETTRAILVQNLVRTLCKKCSGSGCASCFQTGYASRRIVSEVQSFSDPAEFRRMVGEEIFWPTIIQDAFDLMESGETDLRELRRVYGTRIDDEFEKRKAGQQLSLQGNTGG
jgi:general secretion pathway protein E